MNHEVYDGIIGLAIGDALGVPVEFKSRIDIAEDPVISMRGYGTHNQPAGTWSDDTSLTLALLDSLVTCKGVDYRDIMDKFTSWLMYGEYTATGEVFDIGNSTSRAIMNYGRGMNPLECGGVTEYENGNGALMRILPIAYYLCARDYQDVGYQIEIVNNIASLTHQHSISLIGCDIYVRIAMKLITESQSLYQSIEQGVEEIISYYDKIGAAGLEVYDRLRNMEHFSRLPKEVIRSSGYVVDTLEAVLWCLLNTDSFKQGVLNMYELFSERTINIAWMMDLFSNTYNKIEELLAEGFNVVLDRYILSAKVYSIATTNSNISDLFSIYELLPKPDICLYIMVGTECALKRIDDRGEEKVYYENEEYLTQISRTYKDNISKEKYLIEVLDGNLSIEEVTEKTLAILKYNGINLVE